MYRVAIQPTLTRLPLIGDGGNFHDRAIDHEILSTGGYRESRPAISLPDEFERLVCVMPETNLETEKARIEGRANVHADTHASTFRDVLIVDGVLYSGRSRWRVGDQAWRPFAIRQFEERDRAVLCTNYVINRYFGHWINDGLTLELLAQRLGLPPLTISDRRWLHEPGYRSALNMFDDRAPAVRVAELTVVDDRGLNEDWIERYGALRQKIRQSIPRDESLSERIFLARGSSGSARSLLNEAEIADELTRYGFEIVHPERESAENLSRLLSNAKLVVTVEGSAIAHAALSMRCPGAILAINPPRRFNSVYKARCDAIGLVYGFVVADDAGEDQFRQPPDRLLATIDLLQNAMDNRPKV